MSIAVIAFVIWAIIAINFALRTWENNERESRLDDMRARSMDTNQEDYTWEEDED